MSVDRTKLLAIAPSLEKFGKQFQGILDGFQFLSEIGSLEQAANEAQARLDAANKEQAAVLATIEADKAAAQEKLEAAAKESEAAKQAARAGIAACTAESAKIIADAKARADALLVEAKSQASKIVEEAHQSVTSVRTLSGEMANAVNEKEQKIKQLDVTLAERQAQLDTVNAHMAELKAKLG